MFQKKRSSCSSASISPTSAAAAPAVERLLDEAPDEYGLLITLNNNSNNIDNEDAGGMRMEYVPDQHFADIHPHGHGPATLEQLQLLSGGGSGVRVFAGQDPELGSLVMKHGSDRDTQELFALATIARELIERQEQQRQLDDKTTAAAADAAQDMRQRIPDFRMIYISPQHLQERPKEFWMHFKSRINSLHQATVLDDDSSSSQRNNSTGQLSTTLSSDDQQSTDDGSVIRLYKFISSKQRQQNRNNKNSSHATTSQPVLIARKSHAVNVVLGNKETYRQRSRPYALRYGAPDEGYYCLKAFVDELVALQKSRGWKFTLAQQTIGGPSPKTAAAHLADGNLHGALLERLVDEYISVIHNLQNLTRPEEMDGAIEIVANELRAAEKDRCALPFDISDTADAFVGFSIKKNWLPDTGRFFCLRRLGKAFRQGKLHLTEEEKVPAQVLGILLKEGTRMNDVFAGVTAQCTALEVQGYKVDSWRSLLNDAISLKSPAARNRIWNCGLADGGLHNLFLSTDRMLYLFDMGEPKLMPLPAFLTKFLFSFFHTLGMVDDKQAGRGWVNRFKLSSIRNKRGSITKLMLTEKTKELVPLAYSAFKATMDRLVHVFFVDDDPKVIRALLLNYVTLQLLSDAAFCLQRWKKKGGGRSRKSNHHKHIEEWLWRSIWDIYIASDLNTNKRLVYLGIPRKHRR